MTNATTAALFFAIALFCVFLLGVWTGWWALIPLRQVLAMSYSGSRQAGVGGLAGELGSLVAVFRLAVPTGAALILQVGEGGEGGHAQPRPAMPCAPPGLATNSFQCRQPCGQ